MSQPTYANSIELHFYFRYLSHSYSCVQATRYMKSASHFHDDMCNLKLKCGVMYMAFLFALLQFTCNVKAGDSDFIRDYFVKKAVRNVVGFSCGDFTSK